MAPANPVRLKHREGFEELNAFWDTLDKMEHSVEDYAEVGLDFVEEPVDRVLEKIRSFEPQVSIIGQVKSGKSTLLNALIGETDLLPSDVNPWTSVITGIHVNSRQRPPHTRALFRFFDAHEWDRLVATGGRLGEMAARAGFSGEAKEVRAQVNEMRQTTEERLGDAFDELLGTSHAFPEIDKDVIDRYVCYGDPDELDAGASDGVFADVTKAADLYIDLPGLPRGLCLRDTPGVNDTFMMREQITLNAISDSRVCVVVLSAHQALSTMDLALLRIICSVEAREVLIFVNRMDELADPLGEAERIEVSIRRTLGRMGLAQDVEILFGSGAWANAALSPGEFTLGPASAAALGRMAKGKHLDTEEGMRLAAMDASGVPALHRAIAARVVDGPCRALLADVRSDIDAIIEMSETVENIAAQDGTTNIREGFGSRELSLSVAEVREAALEAFDERAAVVRGQLRERLERGQETFVESAIEALQAHINLYGEFSSWKHDPSSLRMAMKAAFTSATVRLRREGEAGLDMVMDGMDDIFHDDLGVTRDSGSVDFPEQPQHKAPTVLARTLSLDLEGPWWRRFWKFGHRKAAAKRYRALIEAEIAPLIDDLLTQVFDPAVQATREVIETFAMDQGAFARAVLDCAHDMTGDRDGSDEPRRLIA
ncbi:dynamin family protein [Salipiger pallidus]|uniref:Dynamin family protein n=1 Tax=Salipiger pallidus TaxID=1775170 RepID=A0A8J3EEF2_9RHOB|nr:dynamin family protein [Salipiger pallidus]GGG63668.1 dynamin family protein [Salipiger pallidus]